MIQIDTIVGDENFDNSNRYAAVIRFPIKPLLYFYDFIGSLEAWLVDRATALTLLSDWLKYSHRIIFSNPDTPTSYGVEGQPYLAACT